MSHFGLNRLRQGISFALLCVLPMSVVVAQPTATTAVINASAPEDFGTVSNVFRLSNYFAESQPSHTVTYTLDSASLPSVATATVDPSTGWVDLQSIADANGTQTIVFRATDNLGLSDTLTFNLTVDPENDAPTVAAPLADVTVAEDAASSIIDLSGVFADVDIATNGDTLGYSVSTGGAAVISAATVSGTTLTLDYVPNAHGVATVTVRATDVAGLFVEDTFQVTVNAVNDAPTVTAPLADVTVSEDAANSTVNLNGVFGDVDIATDGDTLTYSVSATGGAAVFTSATVSGSTVTLDYAPDQNGVATVTVRATDVAGAFVEDTFQVTVNAVNDTPFVANLPPMGTFAEDAVGATIDLSNVFDDVDLGIEGDALTLSVLGTTGTVIDTAVMAGTNLDLTFLADQNGSATVTVRATDIAGAFVDAIVDVEVTAANDAPTVVAGLADVTVAEDAPDSSIDLSGVFDDVDIATNGDLLTYSVSATGGAAVFTSATVSGSTLTLDYAPNQNGVATVTVRATDVAGAFVEDTFQVTVNAVNDTPFVANPPPMGTFAEDAVGATVDLSNVFDDVDLGLEGDTLTLSVQGTTGAVIDTAVMNVTNLDLTFLADQNGSATVTVRATDMAGAFVDATVDVEVTAVNDAPTVAAGLVDLTVDEDAADSVINVSGVFDDVDIATNGDTLTYSVSTGGDSVFTSATVVGSTLTLDYAPDQNGVATVTVRATDSASAFVENTFQVSVNAVNDAPMVVAPLGDVIVGEDAADSVIDVSGAFDDVDITTNGDALTYTVSTGGDAVFTSATVVGSSLTLDYALNQNGVATVTVRATDIDGAFVENDFQVTVNPVNDPPMVAAPLADVSVAEDAADSTLDLSGVFDDVDGATNGDTLTYTVSTSGDGVFTSATVSGSTLTLDYAPNQNGVAMVTVRATDVDGAFAEDDFQVTVNAVNDAPFVANPPPLGTFPEDAPGGTVDLSNVFDDVDQAIEGDTLTLSVVGTTGAIIDTAVMTGTNLDLTFLANQNGAATVTVRATDSAGAFVDVDVDVGVSAVNDAPTVVAPLPDVVVDEDAPDSIIGLTGVFDDIDIATNGDTLTYSVSALLGDAVLAAATVSGSSLNLEYAPDQNGIVTVTVRATDIAGAFADTSFQVTVNAVNDAPFVANPIADFHTFEDAPNQVIDLAGAFDDVDIATNGDVVTLSITGVGTPTLFDSVGLVGDKLTIDLALDQNGSSTVEITATDSAGATVSDTFIIYVDGVNDVPTAVDDAITIDEDSGPVVIDVLPNDYLAEEPTAVTAAGAGGFSESDPTTILSHLGDPITAPNGTVTIVGDQIQYEPKANFHGEDFFTYTITDVDGDTSTATVTVTVNPVNDPPVGVQEKTYFMQENGSLVVDAETGLLVGSYDVDGALLDAFGNPVGEPLTSEVTAYPAVGLLTIDQMAGTFEYVPPVDYIGDVVFEYRLNDGAAFSTGDAYRVRVVVLQAPEPPAPPPPGQVALPYNLTNVPLEQSTSVPPNVLVVMDDSGSMDWNMIVAGAGQDGGFELTNRGEARRSSTTSYTYLWDLPSNAYPPSAGNGRVLPTEEGLAAEAAADGWGGDVREYGVWRARNHLHNRMYYNPEIRYTPWVGQDANNVEFADADPENIRLDPVDPTNLFDMMALHSYRATYVPVYDWNGGRTTVNVSGLYVPRYYTTPATPPLAWNDPHTLVEIKPENAPFVGGPDREDCAIDDGDPLTCTYEQEIQNFANYFQYYRSREYVTKNGIGKVVSQVQDVRVGYQTISATTSEDIRDMNALHTEGNKKLLMDNIYRVDSYGGTPLRQALGRAGDTFACTYGRAGCPALPAPEGFCQQNFALLFSDGYWNGGTGTSGNVDGDSSTVYDGGRYADSVNATLADVAMYYYENDLQPDLDDQVPVMRRDVDGVPEGVFTGAEPKMHQHMKTYTIAFGVTGTVDPASVPTNPTTPFSWPNPFSGNLQKIDDMLHTAINGRGRFLNAGSPLELQAAFESAFLEFTQAASSTSSAAFNSTSLRDGTLLYRGFYDLRDNTGELTATLVNDDGTLGAVQWEASDRLNPENITPADRVIVTYDRVTRAGIPFDHGSLTPEQQLTLNADEVGFLRGERDQENPLGSLRERPARDGLLGDIVNSSPVFVGAPRSINRDQRPYPVDDLYSVFADAVADRTPVVYVGANDGMMHGFNAVTGDEVFAYVPNKIIDSSLGYHNPLDLFTSPFYQHRYFVDLTPRLNDVYMRASPTAVAKSWNSVLVGGLGAGGKGFYALNVTDPDLGYSSETNAQSAVLWEFTDEDDTYPVDSMGNPLGGAVGAITDPLGDPVKDLGYSLSLPVVAMSNVDDGGSPAQKEWVALFGNGPNSTAGIAKLFVLFMDRGLNGWADGDFVKLDTGFGVPVPPHPLAGFPNGLGSPAAVDVDLNGTVDRVYAGDRLGNLFRFDLSDANPDNWTVTRVFTATYTTAGGDTTIQPILTQPLVIKHPTEQGFLVIFGTGSYLTRDDANSEDIQSIYAIWDRGESSPATALDDTRELRLVEQTITNVVDDSFTPPVVRRIVSENPVNYELEGAEPGTYGWYIDLDMERADGDTAGRAPPEAQFPGEKAIRRLLFRDGTIITTTVLPSLDEFSCFGTRPGSILVFDAVTGGDAQRPVVDFNNDGVVDNGDLVSVDGEAYAGGILFNQSDLDGALVDLSTLGGEGDTDFLFVSGGNETRSYRIEDVNDNRTGRLSWRELDD